MSNIKEIAEAYEPKETKNIADLDKVQVNATLTEVEYTDKDGKSFKVWETEIDGESYRVPKAVLKQLKAQLEEKPETEFFKVKKEGSGLSTEYTVVLLD